MPPTTSYDSFHYASQAYSFTHPLRLQTLATLFGVDAPDARRARILELGCADAVNICGIASTLPESTCIGIDTSAPQVAIAKSLVDSAGITNLQLVERDFANVGTEFGSFDYIICHGLFSWIDPEAQQKLLRVCQSLLTPNGVAYISYNTLPGWYPRRMIREMLLYHAEQFRDSDLYVYQARAMITLFETALRSNSAPLSVYLKNALKQIKEYPDWYLRHDVLEDFNEPLYFHQFATLAAEAHLQYVGDAVLSTMVDVALPDEVRKPLRMIANDVIRFEQYLDFLANRPFRRSLVCRDGVKLSREEAPARVEQCFIASPLKPVEQNSPDGVLRFELKSGAFIETNDPFTVCTLKLLAKAWPQSRAFNQLWEEAEVQLKAKFAFTEETRKQERGHLAQAMWNLAIRDLIEIQVQQFSFSSSAGSRPQVSRFARLQAERGAPTNLRHEVVQLSELAAAVLPLLDGTRDIESLREELARKRETAITPEQLAEVLVELESSAFFIAAER